MLSADNICKQIGPRSGSTKCWAWSGCNLFGAPMVFLKEFFENVDFKKSADDKKHEKFSRGLGQRVKVLSVGLSSMCTKRVEYGKLNNISANCNKNCLLFSSAVMFKKPLWQTVCTQIRLCSGSTLFAFILNLSVMLGNYLQQTTSADNIFSWFFFLVLLGLKCFMG